MGMRRSNSKGEMSHSDLAAAEKKPIGFICRRELRSLSPIHGIHYPENIFKNSSLTKKLEEKSRLLILGEVRVQLAKTGLRKQANRCSLSCRCLL